MGAKSDLLHCLESTVETETNLLPATDATILDGAAVVSFLRPLAAKSFDNYTKNVFVPYIKGQLPSASRMDIVWDRYFQKSLKSQTRSKGGKGVRRVEASANLPGNWQQFLRIDANKTELFSLLAERIICLEPPASKQLVTIQGAGFLCTPCRDISNLAPCDHKEADTTIILRMAVAARESFHKILLRTVVTAVAAIAKLDLNDTGKLSPGSTRGFQNL